MNKILYIVSLVLAVQSLSAQYKIGGVIKDERGVPLTDVTVVLLRNDSLLSGAVSDEKGLFRFEKVENGVYGIEINLLGYEPVKLYPLEVENKDIALPPFVMKEDAKVLEGVEISARRQDITKSNARSTTFYLSEKALKESSDAFEAIREVPKLVVDASNKSVRMSDGSAPLILINGINRPGYLETLDPSDITSVEVIENPSSRYRGEQRVTSVVNLKVKRKKQLYLNGYISSKQNVELLYGFSGGSVEVGDEKKSLFVNIQHFYINEKDNTTSSVRNGDILRSTEGTYKKRMPMLYVNIGGDWIVSDKDYLSFGVNTFATPSRYDMSDVGKLTTGTTTQILNVSKRTNYDYFNDENTLYYRRQFSKSNQLELKGKLSVFKATSKGWRNEKHGNGYGYASDIDMDNAKTSYTLEGNYTFDVKDKLEFNAGNNLYGQNVWLDNLIDTYPQFKYKEWREYAYIDMASVGDQKFSYTLSLGLDVVFANADRERNQYINFVPTFSMAYKFNTVNVLKLNGSRNRLSPSIGELNPRNVSTDSLSEYVGNPYLKPSIDNRLQLSYEWSAKGIYLSPYITYDYYIDLVEAYGKMSGNIYKSSYRNMGSFQRLRGGVSSRLSLGNLGMINLSVFYDKSFYDDSPFDGGGMGVMGNLYLNYKKLGFSIYANHGGMEYTRIGKSKSHTESEATLTWKFSNSFSANIGLRYFLPGFNNYSWEKDGEYESYDRTSNRHFLPMIGFSYSFRNKTKSQYRDKKRFWNSEEGVNINVK